MAASKMFNSCERILAHYDGIRKYMYVESVFVHTGRVLVLHALYRRLPRAPLQGIHFPRVKLTKAISAKRVYGK